jgi:hypothetical protein
MAGDWIPIEVTLHGKPEVAYLSTLLERPIDECVGTLIRFWCWCQAHTRNGVFDDMDEQTMSLASGVRLQFLDALQDVGWLVFTEDGQAIIPNYNRWFGGSSKRRMVESERKRRERERDDGAHSVRNDADNKRALCPQECGHNTRTLSATTRTRSARSVRNDADHKREEKRIYIPP